MGSCMSMGQAAGTAQATQFLTEQCPECFATLFPRESRQSPADAYAIMAYDGMLTAIYGIRSPGGPVDTPKSLIHEFKELHAPGRAIPGASGWISLDNDGTPINKAEPIVSIQHDGSTHFERLSSPSPTGKPCMPTEDRTSCTRSD